MAPRRHIHDQRRAEVKAQLKQGTMSLSQVLVEAQVDDAIGGMRVVALLESLPGIGKVRSRQIMESVGVTESGLVRELSASQWSALEGEYRRLAKAAAPRSFPTRGYVEVHQDAQQSVVSGSLGIEDWDR